MVGIETIQPRGFGRILIIIPWYYYTNTIYAIDMTHFMPKVSLDVPQQLLDDLKIHVGDGAKFVSVADAFEQLAGNC